MQINSTSTILPQSNRLNYLQNSRDVIQKNTADKNSAEEVQQNNLQVEVNVEEIHKSLENINKIFKPTHLEFQLHEASGKYFVHLIDDMTQKVLKQIPSKEFLEMVAVEKERRGLLVDKRI